MREVNGKTVTAVERRNRRSGLLRPDLPAGPAVRAIQMSVLAVGPDMEFLTTVGAMGVTNQAEFLKHMKRPVDGRRRGLRVAGAATIPTR